MPTNTMKNTRFSVRQTERLCTLSSLESSPTNSKKGVFSAPLSHFFLLHVEFHVRNRESALNRFILHQSKKF